MALYACGCGKFEGLKGIVWGMFGGAAAWSGGVWFVGEWLARMGAETVRGTHAATQPQCRTKSDVAINLEQGFVFNATQASAEEAG